MNGYQWTGVPAPGLGCGFDVFDGQLVNSAARHRVPTLLGLTIDSPPAPAAAPPGIPDGAGAATAAMRAWAGFVPSVRPVGGANGGLVFGQVADRRGGTRPLLLATLLCAVGTAACAFAPNPWVLMLFRLSCSL